MGLNSFRNRLLLAVFVLIVLVQAMTIGAVLERTRVELRSGASSALSTRVEALHRMVALRTEGTISALQMHVEDEQNRNNLTNADSATTRRALANLMKQRRSQIAFETDGESTATVTAATEALIAPVQEFAASPVLLREKTSRSMIVVLDGRPFRISVITTGSRDKKQWVGVGFEVNDASLETLRDVMDLELSYMARDPDGRRTLVSTLPRPLRPQLFSLSLTPVAGQKTGQPQIISLDDQEYLTALVPMYAKRGDVYAIVQRPMREMTARFQRLRLEMIAISGVALLIAAGIVTFVTRRALRPIDQLVQAAQRIEQGRYNERVTVSGGKEFERLANVIDSMQRRIAERESRIVHQARHDQLTGLPNRLAARSRLARLLKAHAPVGLVVLDLRGFKHLNASFGHELGDQILREIARRLQSAVRTGDYVARLGTDQYLLLLNGSTADHAEAVASQVVRDVRPGLLLGSIAVNLDVHAGVCAAPEHGSEAEELLRRADIALQEAKTRSVAICRYELGHDETYRKRLKLIAELRTAIGANQLHLVYQPKVQMGDRRVRSLEALVRWNHPQLGPVPPSEFVPLAEQTGTIGELTRWVLRTAIEQLAGWRAAGFETEVAVNLSASDLIDMELPDGILALLAQADVLPRQLLLEITESAIMREPEKAVRVMRRLREAGIRFSIDDFGTGHSSLAQLKSLPVDEIKIDRSFIRDLEQGTRDDAIVRSAIDLGHSLGLKVVAEGIETPAAWTALIHLGCDYAQGYFVSRPIAADQVGEWIGEVNAKLANAESGTAQVRVLTELRSTRRWPGNG
jgi:diguanylate cyclase (GGDEF)-like protein